MKGAPTFALNLETWEQVVDGQYAIVGSPETVTEMLCENIERLGVGNLLGLFQLGTLPADDTRRNLELFATEVMPKLRARFGDKRRRTGRRSDRRATFPMTPGSLAHSGRCRRAPRGGSGRTGAARLPPLGER